MKLDRRRPRALALGAAFLLALGIAVPAAVVSDERPAEAANVSDFNPAMIISDSLFYDPFAMTAAQIQRFLDDRIGTCTNGRCLNVAKIDFPGAAKSVGGNGVTRCEAVPGGYISAAELIYRVQVACGISAKVILVTLQKEQGLVTSRAPGDWALQHAMGMACPDTAPCDSAFAGLGTQIYTGTRQLITYKASNFARQPGRHFIQFDPNPACGGTYLDIANYATAALYNYTPYQPDYYALANLYGTGGECSSYGNRNFWRYYTDWFGSTNGAVADALVAAWEFAGGNDSWLGAPASGLGCGLRNAGCFKWFQNGIMYASLWTPAVGMTGPVLARWFATGAQDGTLGYPTSWLVGGIRDGGSYQEFEFGTIYTSGVGTWSVRGSIRTAWAATGKEWGPAGYPIAEEACGYPAGGCVQAFQGGRVYWSPASEARFVPADLDAAFVAAGGLAGPLGYPIADAAASAGGRYQLFTGGAVYAPSSGGAYTVWGGIRAAYVQIGAEHGAAGFPRSAETCGLPRGGCSQVFENGTIYWSPATGAQYVPAAGVQAMTAAGGPAGWLGYPVTPSTGGLVGGGSYQVFQGGTMYTSTTGSWTVRGAVRTEYAALGNEWGSAGYPTGDELCGLRSGGCWQAFANGHMYWSPVTGARFVPGTADALYTQLDGPAGWLGYPLTRSIGGTRDGGAYQIFQGGTVYISSAGTWAVHGAIRDLWATMQNEWGPAGYPASAETCGLAKGGCFQAFENGRIYWSPATGARYVPPAVLTAYLARGGESSSLGYPAGDARVVGSNLVQRFQGGELSVPR